MQTICFLSERIQLHWWPINAIIKTGVALQVLFSSKALISFQWTTMASRILMSNSNLEMKNIARKYNQIFWLFSHKVFSNTQKSQLLRLLTQWSLIISYVSFRLWKDRWIQFSWKNSKFIFTIQTKWSLMFTCTIMRLLEVLMNLWGSEYILWMFNMCLLYLMLNLNEIKIHVFDMQKIKK